MLQLPAIESIQNDWEEFFRNYYNAGIMDSRKKSALVDFQEIDFRYPDLGEAILNFPDDALRSGEMVLKDFYEMERLRVFNIKDSSKFEIRDIRAENMDKFYAFEGLIKKVSIPKPKIKMARFKCSNCGEENDLEQFEIELNYPTACKSCGKKKFALDRKHSTYIDIQNIEIEEIGEYLRGGESPQSILVYLRDDLVGKLKPGDRIILNGVLRGRLIKERGFLLTILQRYIDCVSYEFPIKDFEEMSITSEDEEKIFELSRDPDILNKFRDSMAPSIYGHNIEKQAMALQLFGGVMKTKKEGGRLKGDINILFVGDPGTAKSQLLYSISKLAPRSIYTSGKGSTAAGLTASAVKSEGGVWELEAGALVLADKGLVCIDEIDKMATQDASALHQAMEQQEISIAKAGITATLNCRCAVLAAANPMLGRFDPNTPIPKQINISTTLLSRFDLIFPFYDIPNPEDDAAMAKHILRIHKIGEMREARVSLGIEAEDEDLLSKLVEAPISREMIYKYVAYAKSRVVPILCSEADDMIQKYYGEIRGKYKDQTTGMSPRQLEAIIRLAEASAKVRLSDKVERRDAEIGINIFNEWLTKVCVDKATGRLDVDVITVGTSQSERGVLDRIIKLVIDLCEEKKSESVPEEIIIREAVNKDITEQKVFKILDALKNQGILYQPRTGEWGPMKDKR